MIRTTARGLVPIAVLVDLAGAWMRHNYGISQITVARAAIITAIALVPCALAFLGVIVRASRWPTIRSGSSLWPLRLPIAVPRGYVGAAVLGGIATLAAMGEKFAPFIFLAGIALIALALSQARPRRS